MQVLVRLGPDKGDEIRRVRKADGSKPIDATIAMALACCRATQAVYEGASLPLSSSQ